MSDLKPSIIELVIPPNYNPMNYCKPTIILDTKGNLYNYTINQKSKDLQKSADGCDKFSPDGRKLDDMCCKTEQWNTVITEDLSIFLCLTTNDLYDEIKKVKNKEIIMIDTLTLIKDEALENFDKVKEFFNTVWDCIYETDSVFIITNHYKINVDRKFEARTDKFWRSQMFKTVLVKPIKSFREYAN